MKLLSARPAIVLGLIALVAGCGGGGGSTGPVPPGSASPPATATPPPTTTPSAPPTATPTPPGASTQTVDTFAGSVFGTPSALLPTEGNTTSGGQGQPIDGKTCDPTQYNNYHVHFFLGLWVNGSPVAIPSGVGMFLPGPPVNGFVDTASCVYYIHTHDSSGIIHIEDPDPAGTPITQSIYTLKQFFDEWGITVNANQVGPFTGPVRVFTSGPVYRGGIPSQTTPASDLTFYGTDATTVPLYSYELIYIEVGTTFPPTLPNVRFYEEH